MRKGNPGRLNNNKQTNIFGLKSFQNKGYIRIDGQISRVLMCRFLSAEANLRHFELVKLDRGMLIA